MSGKQALDLVLLWHMHQPDFRDHRLGLVTPTGTSSTLMTLACFRNSSNSLSRPSQTLRPST